MTQRKVSRETRRQAIRILGEAARTDVGIVVAAGALSLKKNRAAYSLVFWVYYSPAIHVGRPSYREACAIAESLLRQGWEP